ncbi:MAG: hypothetical protein ACPH2J_09235 [Akkermansiaceae bacterium]
MRMNLLTKECMQVPPLILMELANKIAQNLLLLQTSQRSRLLTLIHQWSLSQSSHGLN